MHAGSPVRSWITLQMDCICAPRVWLLTYIPKRVGEVEVKVKKRITHWSVRCLRNSRSSQIGSILFEHWSKRWSRILACRYKSFKFILPLTYLRVVLITSGKANLALG